MNPHRSTFSYRWHQFMRHSRVGFRQAERRFSHLVEEIRTPNNTLVLGVAAVIGILAAFGAMILLQLLRFIQRLGYSTAEPSVAFLMGLPWWLKLIVPAVGGLLVGAIVHLFASEAKGHGVPEVMEAVAVRGGLIRKRVAVAKVLASALSIGSGGSTGREGPIIQIGAAIGSTIGRYVGLNPQRIKVYVACGAAAGIAAAFNAPLAGAIFAAEIIMADFAVGRLGPVVVASVAATAMSRSLMGDERAFTVPIYELRTAWEFLPYMGLGVICGLAGIAFIRLLYWSEDRFDESPLHPILRPALGGLLLGGLSIAVPQVLGIGYEGITKAVLGEGTWYVLLGLAAAKLIATSITLGSGGSGGIFAPSLFLGATLGGAWGHIVNHAAPNVAANPGAYALVGMGGMVAATTHAPITAILILFEMTGSYKIILPLMFACIGAVLLSSRLYPESIYTLKLARRGLDLRGGREMNVLRAQKVVDVMKPDVEVFPMDATMTLLGNQAVESPHSEFFVKDDQNKLLGTIHASEVRRVIFDQGLGDLIIARDLVEASTLYLTPDETLDQAMRLFGHSSTDEIPVIDGPVTKNLMGSVTRFDCIEAYNRAVSRLDAAGEIAYGSNLLGRMREVRVSDGFRLLEVEAPVSFYGKDLKSLELPKLHGLQVLLVRRRPSPDASPEGVLPRANLVVRAGDRLILGGPPDAVTRFQKL